MQRRSPRFCDGGAWRPRRSSAAAAADGRSGDEIQHILDSAFCDYGLPKRIRSDGGPPFFAAASPASISRLGVWLLRLGITLERIAPAAPQQNGRLERFHRTLKREVEVASDHLEQQRRFDAFRAVYNFERPHAALGSATPRGGVSTLAPPLSATPPQERSFHQERADRRGTIPWHRHRVFIVEAFANESLDLWPSDGESWEVHFGRIDIGSLEIEPLRFVPRRRGKGPMRLSYDGDGLT